MADLRRHLLDSRIAGDVATSRQDNLRNYQRMLDRRREYDFGLQLRRPWTAREVLDLMARRCGVDPDPEHTQGQDTIGVDLTLAALDAHRDRLALAAQRRERVLLATGHPTGILVLHLRVAAALRAAGADVVVAPPDWSLPWADDKEGGDSAWARRRPRHVRVLNGVHVLAAGGELLHTHLAEPMEALLAGLATPPDLVVADHGWAGAAAQAGIETLGHADCNDPALFVAEEEGLPLVTVPLDDNVAPQLYDPVSDHLTSWAR